MVAPSQAVEGQLATTSENPPAEQPAAEQPGIVYRAVYGFGYYLSFGVMLPTLLVVRAIPLNNALGHGLWDGTVAAGATSAAAHAAMRQAAGAVATRAGNVYAGVSRRVQERVEAMQDALAERRHRRQIAAAQVAKS